MPDHYEYTPSTEEEFQKIIQIKGVILELVGPLLPIQALMLFNMAIVDILTASAKNKEAALGTIDMMAQMSKKNLEEVDKINAGNWNNKTLQ